MGVDERTSQTLEIVATDPRDYLGHVPNREKVTDERLRQSESLAKAREIGEGYRRLFEDLRHNEALKEVNVFEPDVTVQELKLENQREMKGKDMRHQIRITADLKDKDGNGIVVISRVLYWDGEREEWNIFREQITVEQNLRGKGMGRHILEGEEKVYREHGVSGMILSAGDTDGVHNNAMQGFDFAEPDEKHRANSEMLSYIARHQKIKTVRIGREGDNIYPFSAELSALDLARLRAYNESGDEITFPAIRLLSKAELEKLARELTEKLFELLKIHPSKEEMKPSEQWAFNGQVLLFIANTPADKRLQKAMTFFEQRIGNAKRIAGEEGAVLWKAFANDKEKARAYVLTAMSVPVSRYANTENYYLGKAFFKDMGPSQHFPEGWLGVKRLPA